MKSDLKPIVGSKSPGSGYIYLLLMLILIIIAGTFLSGGFIPVDPTGPNGPPTLEPFYNPKGYGKQDIILPSGALTPDARNNLQLKTFSVNTCGQKVAIDFLIDTSGSMAFEGKMDKLKEALRSFTSSLPGKAVIGIQTFSAHVEERLPLSYYEDVKNEVPAIINGLQASGWTRTRDGVNLAKQQLIAPITADQYPGYQYTLIILTDGVPEVPPDQPRTCLAETPDPNTGGALRCFAQEQDPRVPFNLAQDIKNLKVTIYAVNIYSPNYASDAFMFPYLDAMLKEIVSAPIESHYFKSENSANLLEVFEGVSSTICERQGYFLNDDATQGTTN